MSNDNSQAANDLLNGAGGPPAFPFSVIGATAKGTITNLSTAQAIDYATQEKKFYKDSNPIMQIVITIRQEDGEEARIFVKPAMREAIREAVKAAEATGLEVNGVIAIKYTADEPNENPRLNPKKLFVAQYKAPVAAIPEGDLI